MDLDVSVESSCKEQEASAVLTEKRKMNTFPQQTGLSSRQWLFLLFAFLMGVASVFALERIVPVRGVPLQIIQAATDNR